MKKIFFLIIIFFIFSLPIFSQVKIQLFEINNKKPIPNLAIYNLDKELLGYSDSLGYFRVNKEKRILINDPTYDTKIETIGNINKKIFLFRKKIKVKSDKKAIEILSLVWKNRTLNNPDQLKQYKFNAYSKIWVNADPDSIKYIPSPKNRIDTVSNKIKRLLQQNYLFIGERSMTYKYNKKYGRKAYVEAYKAAGFKDPSIYNLSLSFSIVNQFPEILKPRSIKNNTAQLVDSIYIDGRKTYEIYFFSSGKTHNQFFRSATFYIDAKSFAITKIIGNTSNISDIYHEVNYQLFDNIWFAQSEYIDIKFLHENFIKKINKVLPRGLRSITRVNFEAKIFSEYKDFEDQVDFLPKEFNGYEYEMSDQVNDNSEYKIAEARNQNLSLKELSTYKEINRISNKYKIENKLRFLRTLSTGELEIGFFDLDVFKLISHNLYESFRYQLGGHTNYKLSRNFKLGGYIAKGSNDEEVKFSGDATFYINKNHGGELQLKTETDVLPAGRTQIKYLTPKEEIESKSNNIYNDYYFSYRKLELNYRQDFFKNLDINFAVEYERQRVNFAYKYKNYAENTWFNYLTTSIRMRYAPRVKYIKTPLGKSTLEDHAPYYYLTLTKYWNLFEKSTSAQKLYASAIYSFVSKLGTTQIIGNLGIIFGDTPIMNTFEGMGVAKNGNSLWGRFSVKGYQTFETMNPSSFYSDKFLSFQFTHEFRPIRVNQFKSLHFAFVYNGLIGWMPNKEIHHDFNFETPKNFYQEVGFEANKLLLGLVGVGVYSRLGAYTFGNMDQNLYIKLTANF